MATLRFVSELEELNKLPELGLLVLLLLWSVTAGYRSGKFIVVLLDQLVHFVSLAFFSTEVVQVILSPFRILCDLLRNLSLAKGT